MTSDGTNRSDRGFLLIVIVAGLAIRLIWLLGVHGAIDQFLDAAEASHVALSLARGNGFADAYYWEQGPTAHLLPVAPMLSAAILWLLGPGSTAANLTLIAWSLAQVTCGYLLARAVFACIGADRVVLRWGSALLFLVIPFAPQETIDFRYWEGGLAVCLAMLNLLLLCRLRGQAAIDGRTIALIAGLSAITFFVSPPTGLAIDVCWAILGLRRWPFRQCVTLAIASALALAVLVAPWAIRNAQVLGTPVLLRSDLGLELAVANHQAALSRRAPELVFADRMSQLYPGINLSVRPIIAVRGGEVRYFDKLQRQTVAWIGSNPSSFAILCLRHLRQFFFPEPWQMYFTGWEGMRAARAWTITIIDLLGLIGLTLGLLRRRPGFGMLAIYVGGVALPYALFQPMSRYIFLTYPVLAFLAVDAVFQLTRRSGSNPAPAVRDRQAV